MIDIHSLSFGLKNTSGRNSSGHIVTYHRGSGLKNKYKLIDFSRELNIRFRFKVLDIIYDPIRSSNIALVLYENGIISYILSTHNLIKGSIIESMRYKFLYVPGSLCFLKYVSRGTLISNIASIKNKYKPIFVRSAGTCGIVLGNYLFNYVLVKMPSKEFRLFLYDVTVVLGIVSNSEHRYNQKRKAGISRFLNKRPIVRGVAMNPVDHPHGGGEGKATGGRHPVSP